MITHVVPCRVKSIAYLHAFSSNGLDSTPELEKGALDSLSNKSDEGSIKSSIQRYKESLN